MEDTRAAGAARLRYLDGMTNDSAAPASPPAVIAWTTWPAGANVSGFARTLIDERLAACVTAHAPVRSVYRWQGAIEEDDEQLVMIKTTADRIDPLRARLRQLHPAEVPEFVVASVVDGDPAYLSWVAASTRHG